jgi:hypothetical protein
MDQVDAAVDDHAGAIEEYQNAQNIREVVGDLPGQPTEPEAWRHIAEASKNVGKAIEGLLGNGEE